MRLQPATALRALRQEPHVRRQRFSGWWRRTLAPEPTDDPPEPHEDEDEDEEVELVPLVPTPRAPAWGPLTRMGQQLRVQARAGFRAAVIELEPGLYLVAEVPEEALRPQFGVFPLLGTWLAAAAAKALARRTSKRQPQPTAVYEPSPSTPRWAQAAETVAGCGCPHCGRP